jgi:hypothetical protein
VTEQLEDPNQYSIGERHDRYVYDFHCPACGSCGELGVPKTQRWIALPGAVRGAVRAVAPSCIRQGGVALYQHRVRARGHRVRASAPPQVERELSA